MDPYARAHSVGGGRPQPGDDAPEQRRPVRRAFLDARALERQVENRREDAKPQIATRSATADSPYFNPRSHRTNELQ